MRVASTASCARRRPSLAAVALDRDAIRLDPHVGGLDVELRERRGHAIARGGRVLERVTQRGRGVDRGEHLAARRFDVAFEALDLAVRDLVARRTSAASRRRAIALDARVHRRQSRRAIERRRAPVRGALSSAVESRRRRRRRASSAWICSRSNADLLAAAG